MICEPFCKIDIEAIMYDYRVAIQGHTLTKPFDMALLSYLAARHLIGRIGLFPFQKRHDQRDLTVELLACLKKTKNKKKGTSNSKKKKKKKDEVYGVIIICVCVKKKKKKKEWEQCIYSFFFFFFTR